MQQPLPNPSSLYQLIQSDLDRYTQTFRLRGAPFSKWRVAFESFLFKPGFQAVFLYRLSHWCFRRGFIYLAWGLSRFNHWFTGAEIEFNAQVGPGFFIAHSGGIVVGRGTILGAHVTLFQGVSFGVKDWHPSQIKSFPKVGDHCVFFSHSAAYGGITLGDYCVVAGHSVVVKDMPEGSLAKGIPATFLPECGRKKIESWENDIHPNREGT